jgi:hypothetical protein
MHGKNLWISCVLAVDFAGERVRENNAPAGSPNAPAGKKKKAAPKDGFSEGSPG